MFFSRAEGAPEKKEGFSHNDVIQNFEPQDLLTKGRVFLSGIPLMPSCRPGCEDYRLYSQNNFYRYFVFERESFTSVSSESKYFISESIYIRHNELGENRWLLRGVHVNPDGSWEKVPVEEVNGIAMPAIYFMTMPPLG